MYIGTQWGRRINYYNISHKKTLFGLIQKGGNYNKVNTKTSSIIHYLL